MNLGGNGGYGHGDGAAYMAHPNGLNQDHENEHLRVPSCSQKEQCGGGSCCKFIGGCFCSHYDCKDQCGGGKKKKKSRKASHVEKNISESNNSLKLFNIAINQNIRNKVLQNCNSRQCD